MIDEKKSISKAMLIDSFFSRYEQNEPIVVVRSPVAEQEIDQPVIEAKEMIEVLAEVESADSFILPQLSFPQLEKTTSVHCRVQTETCLRDLDEIYSRKEYPNIIDDLDTPEMSLSPLPFLPNHASTPILRLYAYDVPLWLIDRLTAAGMKTVGDLGQEQSHDMILAAIQAVLTKIRPAWRIKSALHQLAAAMGELANGLYAAKWDVYGRVTKDGKRPRFWEVLLRRVADETLEEIGHTLQLTRERVRQIESKSLKSICGFLCARNSNFCQYTQRYQHLIDADLAVALLGEDGWAVAKYAATRKDSGMNWYWWHGPELILCNVGAEFADTLNELEANVLQAKDDNRSIDQCVIKLYDAGYRFVTRTMVEAHLSHKGFQRFGNVFQQGRMSLRQAVALIAEEKIKYPLRMTDPTALDELRECLEQMGVPHKAGDRALWVIVAEVMVLCDRGSYISPLCILFPEILGDAICRYVEDHAEDCIEYSRLFHAFQERLYTESNVHNYYFLHGVLMFRYPQRFIYKKDILVRRNAEAVLTNAYHVLVDYLLEAGEPVPKCRIFGDLPGWTDARLVNAQTVYPEILSWGNGIYLHADSLQIDEMDKQRLQHILSEAVAQNNGIVGNPFIFFKLQADADDILRRNRVSDEQQGFSLLKYVFGEDYVFSFQYVLQQWDEDRRFTHEDFIRACLGDKHFFNRTTLYSEVKRRFGTESSGLYQAFFAFTSGSLQCDDENYLLLSTISENELSQVASALTEWFSKNEILAVSYHNWKTLMPALSVEWTPGLICSIVDKLLPEYRVLQAKSHYGVWRAITCTQSSIQSWQDAFLTLIEQKSISPQPWTWVVEFMTSQGLAIGSDYAQKLLTQDPHFSFDEEGRLYFSKGVLG